MLPYVEFDMTRIGAAILLGVSEIAWIKPTGLELR